MASTIRYTQNVGQEQIPFGNYPGGGPIAGPGGQFNDPGVEIGSVREVIAVYQMYGNEVANDIINIYMAQPGTLVDPLGSGVACSGVAGTATLNIGDDDSNGYGLVSSGVAFGANPLTVTPQGQDPSRYASGINVATGQTSPVLFTGGSSINDPHYIGTLALEPQGYAQPGAGVQGSWIQATFATLATPVAGKVLIFKLKLIKP